MVMGNTTANLHPSIMWVRVVVVVFHILILVLHSTAAFADNKSSSDIASTGGGGDKPAFRLSPLDSFNASSSSLLSYRQNVCDRYNRFNDGTIPLRDALSGLAIRPIMGSGDFFNFIPDNKGGGTGTGMIDPDDPGIMGQLMDILAERANFTWRNSYAIMYMPNDDWSTISWTDYLVWSVNHFDISVTWWDHSVERMEKGVAFVEPWYDGSLLLIKQTDPPVEKSAIVLRNWLFPFDTSVWMLILATILISAFVHQFIEYMNDEREERSLYQWISDNIYLSSLNFSQNFEYAPSSLAGRIFGISMSIWALVITATYTANLASLLVQQKNEGIVIDSIAKAIVAKVPICTYAGSNSDVIIQNKYQKAIRRPMENELHMYQALRQGQCGLAVNAKDTWLTYFSNEEYNPDCDLEWVGRQLLTIKSGFAVKADSGDLCSSLIRDVLNLHLTEIVGEGILEELWRKHRAKLQTIDCDAQQQQQQTSSSSAGGGSRQRGRSLLLRQQQSSSTNRVSSNNIMNDAALPKERSLKGGGGGSAAAASGSTSEGASTSASLSMESMLGTFVLHWSLLALSLIVSVLSARIEKWRLKRLEAANKMVKQVRFRGHGPIVGSPPRLNTSVVREKIPSLDLGGGSERMEQSRHSQNTNNINNEVVVDAIKPGISAYRRLTMKETSRRFQKNLQAEEERMWREDVENKLERLLEQESKLERLLTLVEGMSNENSIDSSVNKGEVDAHA